MTSPEQVQVASGKMPTETDLANYARAYIGAYLSAVRQENPNHIPKFAQDHPYAVEVCLMPNGCFVMCFEKAENSSIAVTNQNWEYVNGRVMSGLSYLVTVYPHEGFHLKDASYRGKRDALRDIRVFENSDLVDATRQLERLLTELGDVSKWNKNPLNMAELAMTKLGAIKQEVMRAGPSMDFMTMVEGLKNYRPVPETPAIDPTVVEMIATVEKDFKDLGEVIAKSKTQDARIEELEKSLKTEIEDFKAAIDKKMAKGLAVVLTTADRKIDKAVGAITQDIDQKRDEFAAMVANKEERVEPEIDLSPIESRISELTDEVFALKEEKALRHERPVDLTPIESKMDDLTREIAAVMGQIDKFQAQVVEGQDRVVEQLRSDIGRLGEKVRSLEDYLITISCAKNVMQQY